MQIQRIMDQLSTMVSHTSPYGRDDHHIGVPASNPGLPDDDRFDYDDDFPPMSMGMTTVQYLTYRDKHAPIPEPWRTALRRNQLASVDRMFVKGDGSCSGGSLMLARADRRLGVTGVLCLCLGPIEEQWIDPVEL